MAGRNTQLSEGNVFLGLLIAGFVVLLLPNSLTQKVNFLFVSVFDPLFKIGRDFQPETFEMPQSGQNFVPRREYEKLLKQYNYLHGQLVKILDENEQLAGYRRQLPSPGPALTVAEVITSKGMLKHELLINKGSLHGIEPGQYVLSQTHNNIIGTIRETSESRARVRLLTDANQSMAVIIQKAGTRKVVPGLMFGDGKEGCKILNIEQDTNIIQGNSVFAAPKNRYLEMPVPIGVLKSVTIDEQSPLLWDVRVVLFEDLKSVRRVAVVIEEPKK